jgi:tRNA(fMet)-specific endonuclease VapC
MIALDTNILTRLWFGEAEVVRRLAAFHESELAVPVVVLEEILRGRLNAIRQAEGGQSRWPLPRCYDLLSRSYADLRCFRILPYTEDSDALVQTWKQQRIRVATHDLRIAAIAMTNSATLVTANRRDFELVPNLSVEFWS